MPRVRCLVVRKSPLPRTSCVFGSLAIRQSSRAMWSLQRLGVCRAQYRLLERMLARGQYPAWQEMSRCFRAILRYMPVCSSGAAPLRPAAGATGRARQDRVPTSGENIGTLPEMGSGWTSSVMLRQMPHADLIPAWYACRSPARAIFRLLCRAFPESGDGDLVPGGADAKRGHPGWGLWRQGAVRRCQREVVSGDVLADSCGQVPGL